MRFSAIILGALSATSVFANTPYVCNDDKAVPYAAGVAVQTAIVEKFASFGAAGYDLNQNKYQLCIDGKDLPGTNGHRSFACVCTRGNKVPITAAMVQSAYGQILSGCTGKAGTILIDNVQYGLY
ncbi:hypothetical protein B0I35DRAFT_475403 [Stachybotrys elegans]|uniref:Cyanovirin-N domain-containing protein n=1 Tax=Stachybotrys elegans TaxID=80388 RepID=A0A8K0SY97_9HYPO|nr:hypothetical protein B0I35DRAFT_475403 [Stachybotrys elegans]